MELQDSVKIIQAGMAWANWTSAQKEAMLIALDAIKKQIPQGVSKDGKHSQSCPVCGNAVNWRYCPNCGQKIAY